MTSLRTRILASILFVAIISAVAGGFLTRRMTLQAAQDAAVADFETHVMVRDALLESAFVHSDWSALDRAVADSSRVFGLRVAVTNTSGKLLADSDPGAGLPTNPAGVIDPLSEFDVDFPEDDDLFEPDVLPPVLLYLGYNTDQLDLGTIDTRALVLSLIAVLAAASLLAFGISRRVTGPLRTLTRAAQNVGAGKPSKRVEVSGASELRELATTFNEMASDLERSEHARTQMISDTAHELRNPVGVLQGTLEAAQDGLFAIDEGLVEILHDETVHLSNLVGDLHDLAMADAGEMTILREPVDVRALLRHVVASHRQNATVAGIELTDVSHDTHSDWVVDVDPTRIRQVMSNLVANAIQYTPAGGNVHVSCERRSESITVSVADTGVGMSDTQVSQVFDRFWRSDESRTRATGGSGLGLSICRSIVEAHGGEILVTSTPGQGSVFTFSIPRG